MKIQVLNNGIWFDLDLFKQESVQYTTQTIDPDAQSNINIPFSIPTEVPYTSGNKAVFGYTFEDALSSPDSNGYSARVYNDNDEIVMEGVMIIESIEMNILDPRYVLRFNDNASKLISELSENTMYDILKDTSLDTEETFIHYCRDYQNADIELPYIDMCNDTESTDNPISPRQYLEYGSDGDKSGYIPALKTRTLISELFNSVGYNVRSAFFNINNGNEPSSTLNTEDLYSIFGKRIYGDDNSRQWELTPFNIALFKNEDTYSGQPEPNQCADWSKPYTTTYNGQETDDPSNKDIAGLPDANEHLYYRKTVSASSSNGWNSNDNGYIVSTAGFEGESKVKADNDSLTPTGSFTISLPILEYEGDGLFGTSVGETYPWFVNEIDLSKSTAKVELSVVLYEEGFPIANSKVRNESGDVIQWNFSDGIRQSSTEPHLGTARSFTSGVYENASIQNLLVHKTDIEFQSKDFFPYVDESEFKIVSGRKYQVRMEAEIVDGGVWSSYSGSDVSVWNAVAYNFYDSSREREGLAKGYPKIKLKMTGASEIFTLVVQSKNWGKLDSDGRKITRWNLARADDTINIIHSFENSEETAWDFLRDIMTRFRCDIFWDTQNSEFVIDTGLERKGYLMQIDSVGNENISNYIDTNNPITIDVNNDIPKTISIKNKSNKDWIDEELPESEKPYGSYSGNAPTSLTGGLVNIYAKGELSFNFETSLINRTICGEYSNQSFDSEEGYARYGYVRNKFAKLEDIGNRIAYLKTGGAEVSTYKQRWNPTELDNRGGINYIKAMSNKMPVTSTRLDSNYLDVLKPNEGDEIPRGFYSYMSMQENVLGNFLPKLNMTLAMPDDIVKANAFRYDYFGIESNADSRLSLVNLDGSLHSNNFSGNVTAVAYNRTTFFTDEVQSILENELDNDRDVPNVQTCVAINSAIKSLKSHNNGIEWNGMRYLYLHAGEINSNLRLVNWRDLNNFNATKFGTLSESILGFKNSGVDGANRSEPDGWLNTNFIPSINSVGVQRFRDTMYGFGSGRNLGDNGTVLGAWTDNAYTSIRLNRDFNGLEWRQEVLLNSDAYKWTSLGTSNPKTFGRNIGVGIQGLDTEVWSNGVYSDKTVVDAIALANMPATEITLFGFNEGRTGWTPQVAGGFIGTLQYNWYTTAPYSQSFLTKASNVLGQYVDDVGARMK